MFCLSTRPVQLWRPWYHPNLAATPESKHSDAIPTKKHTPPVAHLLFSHGKFPRWKNITLFKIGIWKFGVESFCSGKFQLKSCLPWNLPAASLVMRGSPLGSSEVDCLRRLQPNDLLRNDTVDGSEILQAHQLRLVVYLPLKKTRLGIHPRWLFGISETSTVGHVRKITVGVFWYKFGDIGLNMFEMIAKILLLSEGVNFAMWNVQSGNMQYSMRSGTPMTKSKRKRTRTNPCFSCMNQTLLLEDHPRTCKWLITMEMVILP